MNVRIERKKLIARMCGADPWNDEEIRKLHEDIDDFLRRYPNDEELLSNGDLLAMMEDGVKEMRGEKV